MRNQVIIIEQGKYETHNEFFLRYCRCYGINPVRHSSWLEFIDLFPEPVE